jgi:hypothetical protein
LCRYVVEDELGSVIAICQIDRLKAGNGCACCGAAQSRVDRQGIGCTVEGEGVGAGSAVENTCEGASVLNESGVIAASEVNGIEVGEVCAIDDA